MSNENYIIMKKPKLLNIKKSPQISNFNNKKLEMKQVNQLIKNDQEFEDEEVQNKINKEHYYKNPFKFIDYLAKKYFIENANTLENLKIKHEMTTNFKKLCDQIKNDITNYTRNEETYLKDLRQKVESKLNDDYIPDIKDSTNNNLEKGKIGNMNKIKNLESSPMTMNDKEFLIRVIGNQGFYGSSPMDGITTNSNALNFVINNKNSNLNDDSLYLNVLSCLKGDKLIAPKNKFIAVKELSLNDIDQKKVEDTQNIIDLKNKMKIEQYNKEISGRNKDKDNIKIRNKIDIMKNNEKKNLEDLISYSNNHINNMKQYQKEKNDLINNLKNKLNREFEENAIKFAMDKLSLCEENLSKIKTVQNNNNIIPENSMINWKERKKILEKEYNDTQSMVNNFLKGRRVSTDKPVKKRNTNKINKKRHNS